MIIRMRMMENHFPKIWVPSRENRDLRQLLWHRHRMVQIGTRIMNQPQAVALNEGLRSKKSCGGSMDESMDESNWSRFA